MKRDTSKILFNEILNLTKENGHFDKAEQILDYVLEDNYSIRELTDHQFDFVARVAWGGNEGIYISCYLEGKFDNSEERYLKIGTFKTLGTSVEDFKIMGELAGALTYYCNEYVNKNIDKYS